ncbi:MFS transporter [Rummeliibacillus sp. JY-2-4R]
MKETVLKNKGNIILAALFCAWVVSFIDRTAISIALVDIGADMSFTESQLGVILSSFFMGYALMQIPGGFLADKFGSKKVIVIAILGWSIFTALTGFAWSLTSLMLIRFLFGIGEGAYPSASTKAIATYFVPKKRTKAQSTMMSSNSIGAAIAPIICAPLLIALGWRHVFLVISLLGVLIIVWFLWASHNAKVYHANEQEEPRKMEKGEYKKLLRNSYLWKVLLLFFFVNIANWGLLSWMPSYLMKVHHVNLSSIGLIAAIPSVFAALGMFFSGRIITKIGDKAKYGVVLGAAIIAITLFLMSNAQSIAIIITYQSIAMAFMGFLFSFIFTAPHRVMEEHVVGSAFGIVNFGGQAAGILSPTIMGALITASGGSYHVAFIFLAASCGMACLVALTLPLKSGKEVLIQATTSEV